MCVCNILYNLFYQEQSKTTGSTATVEKTASTTVYQARTVPRIIIALDLRSVKEADRYERYHSNRSRGNEEGGCACYLCVPLRTGALSHANSS